MRAVLTGRRLGAWPWLALVLLVLIVPPLSAESDAVLAARLQAAVAADAQLASSGAAVSLTVAEGRVRLSGTVRLYRDKLAYERIVRGVAPGVAVLDEVRVEPLMPAADRDIERAIVSLGKLNRFQGAEFQIAVTAGAVRVRGLFLDPHDVLFLIEQLAALEGVRAIEIDALFPV